jgi:hypothetical protein
MMEVEEYIKKKMERALTWWKCANENCVKGNMQAAAMFYNKAMQLYYECASDLIDGTGFKEVKGEKK